MAGSWHHIVKPDDGKLLVAEEAHQMLENGGDWYEFAEEAYGMVWYLAMILAGNSKEGAREYIFDAMDHAARGRALSPGIDGRSSPSFVEKGKDEDYSGQ